MSVCYFYFAAVFLRFAWIVSLQDQWLFHLFLPKEADGTLLHQRTALLLVPVELLGGSNVTKVLHHQKLHFTYLKIIFYYISLEFTQMASVCSM